jgi:hypothetical protein
VLRSTPSLPPPSSPEFSDALRAKLEICKADCFWQDPDADVAAKKVKSATLAELMDLVPQAPNIGADDLARLIEVMEIPVFRAMLEVSAVMQRSDDFVVFTESSWPHFSLNYQILTGIATALPGGPFANIEYIRRVVWRFRSPDLAERLALAQFALAVNAGAPALTRDLLFLCLTNCIDYLEQVNPPYAVAPCLIVVNGILSEDPPTRENPANVGLYKQYILPLLGGLHYLGYHTQFLQLFDLFVKGAPAVTATPTMKALMAHFPLTRSAKAIEFLRMLTRAVAAAPVQDVYANMRSMFLLFANCTALGQVKVAAAAAPIWNRIEIEPLIIDNTQFVFALVYPILQQAQRETWSNDIALSIEDIFRVLNRIDSLEFQALCRGKSKAAPQNPTQDSLKNWAALARAASKADRNLSLGEKLVEIQKVFSAASTQYHSFASQAPPRSVKGVSLPVTTEKPLGIRTDLRPLIRAPV